MLFIHEITHLVLSLIAGTAFAILFKKKILILYAVLIGVFIDADHIFDYLLYKKSFSINLHEFFSGRFFDIANKVILPFHGFEYVVLMVVIGALLFRSKIVKNKAVAGVLFTLALSLFFHLIYDSTYYRPKWPTYFISYRIYHHFDHDSFWSKANLNEK